MGGTETSSDDENVQTAQQELHDSLPENVKGWIAWEMNKPFEDRDPSYVVVNNLLNSAATATTWLTNVTQSIPSDKIDQQNILKNTGLPMVALQSTTNQMNTVLNMGQNWLNAIGSNDPNYDSLTNYMTQAGALLDNLSSLKASIENGNGTADTKQNLVETAFAFDKLSASFHNVSTGNDMQILGAYLDSLATVSAAWGMEGGSPSLLIGLSTASLGLQSDASETGILNSHYSAVADALVDGVLSSATLGTRAELQELQGLYNELASLAG